MICRILCQNVNQDQINAAMNISGYEKEDDGIFQAEYSLYLNEQEALIGFTPDFELADLIFLLIDLFETTRNQEREIVAYFFGTSNHLNLLKGNEVFIYLREELENELKKEANKYLDVLDIATESNDHYLIDIDSFQLFTSDDSRSFEPVKLDIKAWSHSTSGAYLYEKVTIE